MSSSELFYGNPYPEKYYIYSLHKPLIMKFLMTSFLISITMNLFSQTYADTVPYTNSLANMVYKIYIFPKDTSLGSKNYGTAFRVRYQNKMYLITAKHLISDLHKSADSVTVRLDQGDKRFQHTGPIYFFPLEGQSDIAVIPINYLPPLDDDYDLSTRWAIKNEAPGVLYLGFPNPDENAPFEVGRGRLVKVDTSNPPNPICIYETKAREGFSGAPVFMYNKLENRYYIASIISAGFLDNLDYTCGTVISGAKAAIDSLIPK